MLFFLATPESTIIQTKTTKIKVHLSSGIAEILESHQDLMGKIDNDIVEFETNFENKVESTKYLVQEGVFVVSTKNSISANFQGPETAVYVYGKSVFEISPKTKSLLDGISKEFEKKSALVSKEEENMKQIENTTASSSIKFMKSSDLLLLKREVDFLRKVIFTIKEIK